MLNVLNVKRNIYRYMNWFIDIWKNFRIMQIRAGSHNFVFAGFAG